MIKFFAVFLVLALATTVHSQGDSGSNNANRPLISEYLKGTLIDDLVTLGCIVKDMLSDREVSDHIYKITGGLLQDVLRKGFACMKPIVFGAMNNHSSAIGKAVTILRLGNQDEITRIWDLFKITPQGPSFMPFLLLGGLQTMVQQIDRLSVETEMESIFKQIGEQCHKQEAEEVKDNIKFVIKRFLEKLEASRS